MALQKSIDKLKNINQPKDNSKVFTKNNGKGRYYTKLGDMSNRPAPKPKFTPKPKQNTVLDEPKKEGKFSLIDYLHKELTASGFIKDHSEHQEPFDKKLFDTTERNVGPSNKSSVNAGSHSAANKEIDLSSLEKPLTEINVENKNQTATFKMFGKELTKQTDILKKILIVIEKKEADGNTSGSDSLMDVGKKLFKKKDKLKPALDRGKEKLKSSANSIRNVVKSGANAARNTAGKTLGNISRIVAKPMQVATGIAKNAATTSMDGRGMMAGSRILAGAARAALPALAVAGAGYLGYKAGGVISDAIDGTSAQKAIGEGVAKTAAFFGSEEAKQAVADAKKYEGFGSVASQEESGGRADKISSGKGDHGGKSYGAYQLSSKTGDVNNFLKESGYAEKFKGLEVGSKQFDEKWKEVSKDKGFKEAQTAHATKTHYAPQMAKLKKGGIDLTGRGAAVKEAVLSTANQYGASTDLIKEALKGKDASKMSDTDIINAIQDYKKSTIDSRFKSSSAEVKAGVAKRVERERKALLAIKEEPKDKKADTVVAKDNAVKLEDKKEVVATKDDKKEVGKKEAVATTKTDKFKSPSKDQRNASRIEPTKTMITDIPEDKDSTTAPIKTVESVLSSNNSNKNNIKFSETVQPAPKIGKQVEQYTSLSQPNSTGNANANATQSQPVYDQPTPTTNQQSSGGQVASNGSTPKSTNTQNGADSKGSDLQVRKVSSTIQRVLDKDFHLSV